MEDSTVEQDFETLPVVSFKDEILAAVKNNQIVIIIGETGSGKTTQIPQFFADENLLGGKQMAVTQPRRIAAITVAERVSNERKSKVGEEIGYAVRFDDKTSAKTKVKYMTDGILVRECLSDKALSNYNVIMLDEAHERSLNTDILFGLLKGACALRPDLRLIVTSATLNTDKFGPYFLGCPIIHVPGRVFPVDIYHSKTKQVMTATGPSNSSYVQAAVDVVLKIHKKDEDGHILVFLTGQEEIERACSLLRTALAAESSPDRELIVLPLYAALTSEQQARVFKNPKFLLPKGTVDDGTKLLRKCVIATNIAETSITVPQVRFVVDAGYVKQKAYDPNRGMESLVIVPSSKIASLQRAGRAGRTGPGQCYRLYSSECFDNMMEETVPEIQRINLANTVLYLKALGIQDILGFDFLDPPSVDQIMEALSQLRTLGAIDAAGYVTPLGRQMSSFPLEPNLARMLIESATSECDCLEEVTSICAMLSAENIWITPPPPSREAKFAQMRQQQQQQQHGADGRLQMNFKGAYGGYGGAGRGGSGGSAGGAGGGRGGGAPGDDRQNHFLSEEGERARRAHAALSHPFGDFHTLLHVYNTWVANGRSPQWCDRNYVNFRSIKTVSSIREHLARDAQKVLNYNSASRKASAPEERSLEKRICTAITTGFYMNSAALCAHGSVFKYLSLLDLERQRNRQEALDVRMVHIHPTSSLAIEGTDCPHTTLVYQALAHGNKLYMKQVCKADSKRLKQLQKDWVYVDPYVLCGRRQKEEVVQVAPAPQQQRSAATSTSGSGSGGASSSTASTSSASIDRRNTPVSAVTASSASSSQPAVGSKRPLPADEEQPTAQRAETSASAPAAAPSSGAAVTGGVNQAAEAAKQRYLERMAQQKNRKK